jgi:hypothetical protein
MHWQLLEILLGPVDLLYCELLSGYSSSELFWTVVLLCSPGCRSNRPTPEACFLPIGKGLNHLTVPPVRFNRPHLATEVHCWFVTPETAAENYLRYMYLSGYFEHVTTFSEIWPRAVVESSEEHAAYIFRAEECAKQVPGWKQMVARTFHLTSC